MTWQWKVAHAFFFVNVYLPESTFVQTYACGLMCVCACV